MTRPQFYSKTRTRADKRAAMEIRLVMAKSIDSLTEDDLVRNGFSKAEAAERLALEKMRRAG